MVVKKIAFVENLVDPFTNTLFTRVFDGDRDSLGIKCVPNILQGEQEIVGIEPQKA